MDLELVEVVVALAQTAVAVVVLASTVMAAASILDLELVEFLCHKLLMAAVVMMMLLPHGVRVLVVLRLANSRLELVPGPVVCLANNLACSAKTAT